MSYRRDGDRVTLEISVKLFDELLFTLGVAAGAAMGDDRRLHLDGVLRLVNALNEGNPNFRPYEIPEEKDTPQ